MSLINDALKKAQRQRGDHSSPSAAPMPGQTSAPTRPATPASRPQLLLVGAGAALGLVIALGAVFLFRPAPAPSSPEGQATASAETVPAEPAKSSPPPAALEAAAQPANPLAAPSMPPALAEKKADEAPLITVRTAPPPAEENAGPAAPVAPPKPSLRMITAIEAFRIAGVRASGADSKVLMNDRVFRVGDTVEHELGIKITEVAASSITFTDETGALYTRNF